MQVICPNCGARYAVDPLAIGPAGRTVQCARCAHRWFQSVGAGPPTPPPQMPTSLEGPAPDFVIRPQTRGAGLPAVIDREPKAPSNLLTLAVGALAFLVALGAGIYVFRDDILPFVVPYIPPDWRATLAEWRSLLPI